MGNQIGKNIHALRKQQGLTQEELADQVRVSFQAVSKWENGNSLPDISVLPLVANALHCSIDQLMGYAAEQKRITDYEERYKADGYADIKFLVRFYPRYRAEPHPLGKPAQYACGL